MNNLQGIDIVKLLIVVDELNVQPLVSSINISLNFCIKIQLIWMKLRIYNDVYLTNKRNKEEIRKIEKLLYRLFL